MCLHFISNGVVCLINKRIIIALFSCMVLVCFFMLGEDKVETKELEYCYAGFYLRENFFNYLNMDINNFRDIVRVCEQIGVSKSEVSSYVERVKTLSEFSNRYIGTNYAYRNYMYAKKQESFSNIPETFLQNYFELLSSLSTFYNIVSCSPDEKVIDISNAIMERNLIALTLNATIDYSNCSENELNSDTTLKRLTAELDKVNAKFHEAIE